MPHHVPSKFMVKDRLQPKMHLVQWLMLWKHALQGEFKGKNRAIIQGRNLIYSQKLLSAYTVFFFFLGWHFKLGVQGSLLIILTCVLLKWRPKSNWGQHTYSLMPSAFEGWGKSEDFLIFLPFKVSIAKLYFTYAPYQPVILARNTYFKKNK